MSAKAVMWAIDQQLPDAGMKLVLILLANLANDRHESFPGIGYLAEKSAQESAKVASDIDALTVAKLIAETGARAGRNRRAVIRRLGVEGPVHQYESPF